MASDPILGLRLGTAYALNDISTFARVAIVGLVTNGVGYLAYLGACAAGVDPKLAMSILFAIGTCIGFVGNRQWSFVHKGQVWQSALRYVLTYVIAYAFNWAMLRYFVDALHYSHALVQAAAMAVLVVYLFLALRFFVFPHPQATAP